MRNKNVAILAAAAVALLVVAYILSRSSSEASKSADAGPVASDVRPSKNKLEFPRDKARRIAKENAALPTQPPPPAPPPSLDAMQRALLGPDSKGAVFVEA